MHIDFETYSEAGTFFNLETQKFSSANIDTSGSKKGLTFVGAYIYAEHHSTEVLTLSYTSFKDNVIKRWNPELKNPEELLNHVKNGNLISAYNSFFEWCIWNLVCTKRYGWPPLYLYQTRDSMANTLAFSLPGALDKASKVIHGTSIKDMGGKKIMQKLSQPRNPTKKDMRLRYKRNAPLDGKEIGEWDKLDSYCDQDVKTEMSIAEAIPDLTPTELKVWKLDQRINARGIGIDLNLVKGSLEIFKESKLRSGLTISQLTNGKITSASQATAILKWVNFTVVFPELHLKNLELPILKEYLTVNGKNLPLAVKEVLKIRQEVGGNAPAKLINMKYRTSTKDSRIRGVFQYCGAQRTKRWAGRGLQTQNMPNTKLEVHYCEHCEEFLPVDIINCPYCQKKLQLKDQRDQILETAIHALSEGNYDFVAKHWGNPMKLISACLKSMLVAAPGYRYISSDYSAIEAVVMACMAGEQWIIDVFLTDGKLYERTGAKITNINVKEILHFEKQFGKHHESRKLGKVAALASQYQGARGAWLKFGAGKFLTDKEIDKNVKIWRENAPNIVAYWGTIENAAIQAVLNPDRYYPVYQASGMPAGIEFLKTERTLRCILPNNEVLNYLDPSIKPQKKLSGKGWKILEACEDIDNARSIWDKTNAHETEFTIRCNYEMLRELLLSDHPKIFSKIIDNEYKVTPSIQRELTEIFFNWVDSLYYWGVNTNNKWVEMSTYGGKLAENITQSVARFILSNAMLNVEASGYSIVMHKHDDIVVEVPENFGSLKEFEEKMSIMPAWARLPDGTPWPIKAVGGWEGKRYR